MPEISKEPVGERNVATTLEREAVLARNQSNISSFCSMR